MSAFLSQLLCVVIVMVWKPVATQTCQQSARSLQDVVDGLQAIYSDETKYVYLFGGDGNSKIHKWDLNSKIDKAGIGLIPQSADRFYSWNRNAVLIDNIVWFIGMRHKTSSYASDQIFKYDVITEAWVDTTNLLPPPVSLSYGCLATNHTHIFLVDGKSDSQDRNPRVLQIYNIARNQWTTTNTPYDDSAQYEWYYPYCHIVHDELFVFGGQFAYPGTTVRTPVRDIHKYSLELDQWTTLPVSLPANSGSYSGQIVFYDDVLYLVGDDQRNIIRGFNINTQTFDETMALPTSVGSTGVILVDNVIYVFGGYDADGAVSNIQYCTLPTAEPTGAPSAFPSISPSAHSANPSAFPSKFPSINPSRFPSEFPSRLPSVNPSAFPSIPPSAYPSGFPSVSPSGNPSRFPSVSPSGNPSIFPSVSPSGNPSRLASIVPSENPSKPTANNHGEAEVVELTESSISPTQLENNSEEATKTGDLDYIYVIVLVAVSSMVFILCCVIGCYRKRGKKKMKRDVDHVVFMNAIDSGVVPDETAAVLHDLGNQTNVHEVVSQKGENMNESDEEDIISGVNTLGADELCNEDFEEEVVVGGNTLGEGDTLALPAALATNSNNDTMDFVGSAEEDEIIVGDDETDMGGTVQ
eukprot:365095_1